MNRLHKKCLLASGMMHGVLFLVLIIGSAFIMTRPKEELAPFEMFRLPRDFKVVDEMMVGGGNPEAAPRPQPVVQPTPPPPQPPQPRPEPLKPEKSPELERQKEPVKPTPAEPEEKPSTRIKVDLSPKKIAVNLKPVDKPSDDKPDKQKSTRDLKKEAREAKDREVQMARALKEEIDRVGKTIHEKSSGATDIETPGPGGEAYVNYSYYVKEIYQEAWQTPAQTVKDVSDVEVEVTIARDGRVISSSIKKKSGDTALDNSVQQALNRVRKVREFPEGAKDSQRTFRIIYSLLAKQKFG
jgi:TonB family protein